MKKYFFILMGFAWGYSSWAADQLPGNQHFTIKDNGSAVDFLSWNTHNYQAPKPTEKYERVKHFGIWIDFPNDKSCLTTRGLVLERETQKPLEFVVFDPPDPNKPPVKPIFPNACYVAKGFWYDPYTNANYADAKDIEIDHVVPLKNAYLSGAYEWSWRKRCAYFNFLGNPYHLKPIEDDTNTDKLDKGPDRWMPPNTKYHCQYLSNWLRVKAIWQLRISEPEALAIQELVSGLKCDSKLLKMTKQDLQLQRKIAVEISEECPSAPPAPKPVSL